MDMTSKAWVIALALLASPAFAGCDEPKTGTSDTPMFSPPLGARVIGKGRLQFYAAPNTNCAMAGVFVIPKDDLVSYAETRDGWTSVMYAPATGGGVTGWVRSARLRHTGTVGPQ
jgi:hypothetical protein